MTNDDSPAPPAEPIKWKVTYTITVAIPGRYKSWYEAREAATKHVRRIAPTGSLYSVTAVEGIQPHSAGKRMAESGNPNADNSGSSESGSGQ